MRSLILLIAAIAGFINVVGVGQENTGQLRPLVDLIPIKPDTPTSNDRWFADLVDKAFSGQEFEPSFSTIVPKISVDGFVLQEPKLPHPNRPPVDSEPIVAKRLTPQLLQPVEESEFSDDSHVVLASAETEIAQDTTEEPSATQVNEDDSTGDVTDEPTDASDSSQLQSQIDKLKKSIGSDEQIENEEKTERLERLTAAENWLQQAASFLKRRQEFENQLNEYPAELERLGSAASEELEPESLKITLKTTADSLLPELQSLQQELREEEARFNDHENNIETLNSRITEIPSVRANAADEFKKVEEVLAPLSEQDEDLDKRLLWIVQRSKQLALQAKMDMLDFETRRQELAGKVLPMQRDEASRKIKRLKARIEKFENTVAELRQDEVNQQAEQARLEAINAHPALQDLANRNQELTQLRANINLRIQEITDEDAEVELLVKDLVENKQLLEQKIEAFGGVTHSNGMHLVESRRTLVSPYESMARIKEIQAIQQTVNVAVLTLEEQRKLLADPEEFIEQQMGTPKPETAEQKQLEFTAVKFVKTQRQYLDDLLNDYNRYRGLLETLEVRRNELIVQIEENRAYIDEKALWVRNTDPISFADLSESVEGMKAFFDPVDWTAMGEDLVERVAAKPHEMALGACGLMVIMIVSRRLTRT